LVGWLADICRISGYVAQANCSPKYLERWQSRRGKNVSRIQVSRWVGALFFGIYFEFIAVYALDAYVEYVTSWTVAVVKAVMRTAAVYACFSVGERTTEPWPLLFSSVLAELVLRIVVSLLPSRALVGLCPGDGGSILVSLATLFPLLVCVVVAFHYHRYRETVGNTTHLCVRMPTLIGCLTVWATFMTSATYHHLEVPTLTRSAAFESQKLKHALADFWHSEAYRQIVSARNTFATIKNEIGFRSAAELLARQLGTHPTVNDEAQHCTDGARHCVSDAAKQRKSNSCDDSENLCRSDDGTPMSSRDTPDDSTDDRMCGTAVDESTFCKSHFSNLVDNLSEWCPSDFRSRHQRCSTIVPATIPPTVKGHGQ